VAVEAARRFLTPDSPHPHLVLCGIASEERLMAAADHLFRHDVRFTLFREPDRDNQATALASDPVYGERRQWFERFRCLHREDTASQVPGEGGNAML
jgi:hypothetical protein